VGGPNTRPTNRRWRTATINKKNVPPLSNRLTDVAEIWRDDANWPPTGDRPLKFRIFQKPRWRRPPSWKTTKIAIYQQWIDRSSRNLARLCKMGLSTTQAVKNLNFTNPRWRTAASLKTVRSPYLCNHLTDFDEIWKGDAHWPHTGHRPLKFRIFQKTRWRRPPSWKSQKRDISATAKPILNKFGTVMQNGCLNRSDR